MPSSLANWEFSLKPVKETKVPSFERILDRARALTSASANWEKNKKVGDVQTFSHKPLQGKGPRWWARVSEHSGKAGGNGFDQLWNTLTGSERFTHEKLYNEDLTTATILKTVQWGEIWSLHFTFPPPISPRTCTILTTTHLETVSPRVGWVISVPFEIDSDDIALSLFVEAGVKSNLVSVERLRELDDGKVEWLAASSTSPGGSIPLWLSEYFAIKRITAIVPKVDQYMEKVADGSIKVGRTSSKLATSNAITSTSSRAGGASGGGANAAAGTGGSISAAKTTRPRPGSTIVIPPR